MLYFNFEQKGKKYFYKEVSIPEELKLDTPEYQSWLHDNGIIPCHEEEIDMLICLEYNKSPLLKGYNNTPYPYLMEDIYGYAGEEIFEKLVVEGKDVRKNGVHWRMVKPNIVRIKKDS